MPREAEDRHRRGALIDALSLGIILVILYYLKLSYFVGIAVLTLAAAMLRILPWKTLLVSSAASLLVAGSVELLFRNNALYLAELARAAQINVAEGRGIFRVVRTLVSLAIGGMFGVAAIFIILASDRFTVLRDWIRVWWRPIAIVALIIGAAVAIRVQNHARWELGMFGAALIVAAEYARRRRATADTSGNAPSVTVRSGWRGMAIASLLILGTAAVPALDSASILAHSLESRLAIRCTAAPLRGSPMEKLLFPRDDLLLTYAADDGLDLCSAILTQPQRATDVPYGDQADLRRMLWAVPLLKQQARANDVILALEFANPFPFILRSPPPKGALIWFDLGRSYSSTIHPDPPVLLRGTDIVFETDYPYAEVTFGGPEWLKPIRQRLLSPADNQMGPGQDAWSVYGAAVRRKFTPFADRRDARLWRKLPAEVSVRPPSAAAARPET
jgi:hypothetical protein